MRGLNKLYWLKKEIKDIEEQINELTILKASAISSMPSGNSVSNQIEQFVLRVDKLHDNLASKLKKYIVERERVEKFIDTIDDAEVRVIARMRYIDNYGYDRIGRELYIDQTTARKKLKRYLEGRTDVI